MATLPSTKAVGVAEIERAAETIRGNVRDTPVVSAGEISRRVGATVALKAENLQRTGLVQGPRRATTGSPRLGDGRARRAGVVAASAGNHAQAVAVAARSRGARAVLCMPADAPLAKIEAVRGLRGRGPARRGLVRRRRGRGGTRARRGRGAAP